MSKLEQSQLMAGGFVRVKSKVDDKVTEQVVRAVTQLLRWVTELWCG